MTNKKLNAYCQYSTRTLYIFTLKHMGGGGVGVGVGCGWGTKKLSLN